MMLRKMTRWELCLFKGLVAAWPAKEKAKESITLDQHGQVLVNGKVLSATAIEQRLRRFCSKKKTGVLRCGIDVHKKFFGTPDERQELVTLFKQSLLNKDWQSESRPAHLYRMCRCCF